jgi:hypothetical protein
MSLYTPSLLLGKEVLKSKFWRDGVETRLYERRDMGGSA